jgi:hypothetical protein
MTCHSTCKDYIDYREAMSEKRKIEWEKRMEDSKVRDHIFATKNANEKKMRKR